MTGSKTYLTIGETARRTGVAASALRFYETRGLIQSVRSPGNQRQYHRAMLRKISVIQVAQGLGLSLREIGEALGTLPDQRIPTRGDWERLSAHWRDQLDHRIHRLQQLREKLSGCIGCGCLSLKRCALYNANDRAAQSGAGPRYLLGNSSE
ncbi:MAG: redox-sensitive transcriptional activator SoxR [Gammaproteobacteria bacterium]|nr:redox-sensitive transcriptional activator SoxR [Gammaproteobacteria bacterium]